MEAGTARRARPAEYGKNGRVRRHLPASLCRLNMFGSEFAADEKLKSADGFCFVGTVCGQRNGGTAGDSEREDTEKALGVDASVILDHPNRALIGVCLLDKVGCGSCIKTEAVFDGYISGNHFALALLFRYNIRAEDVWTMINIYYINLYI